MGGVVRLVEAAAGRYPDVLRTLSAVFSDAQNGHVSGVAIAVVRPDGSISTTFSASHNAPGMLGAISLLQHRLMDQIEDDAQ